MNEQHVILVDSNDNPLGLMEKMEAHRKALLHRAFSVFIFNSDGDMLLQKRAASKYHSQSLWTNACCSHPRDAETVIEAAKRRLMEEMGFDAELKEIFSFTYKAKLDTGLIEHEYDHVLVGVYDGLISLNPEEAEDFVFISLSELKSRLETNPEEFTEWFKIILREYFHFLEEKHLSIQ